MQKVCIYVMFVRYEGEVGQGLVRRTETKSKHIKC